VSCAEAVETRFYVERPDADGWIRYMPAVIEVRVEQTGEDTPFDERWHTVAPREIADQWMTIVRHRMVRVDGPARLLTEDEHRALLASTDRAHAS